MPGPGASLLAIGADGARGGWVLARLYADAPRRESATTWRTELALVPDIAALHELHARGAPAAPVAIDIPIGLPATARQRRCDAEARARLGKRRSSVFAPPARYMLDAAGDYPRIRALVARRRETDPSARSISAQAAGLTRKVAEVDAWIRSHPGCEVWLRECHPELSFAELNGGSPLEHAKHSGAGAAERLRLLRPHFPDAGRRLAAARWPKSGATRADMLDAYAALATALRCARGDHEELGGGERDDAGVPMRIAL
jgi:predicted RNase H-like nuclease